MTIKEVEFKRDIDNPGFVLEQSALESMESVVVVGVLKNGELYVAGSTSSTAITNLMLDQAKMFILNNSE